MSEDQTLTPYERKLCGGLLVLALVGAAVLGYYRELVADVCSAFSSSWVSQTLPALRAGKLPRLDLLEVLFAGLVSGVMAALFLISQYLAQLVGWGRWLRLTTLWFWTMIFGVFAGLLTLSFLPLAIAPGFGILLIVTGLVCFRFGGAAWIRCRVDEEAAEAQA